MGAYLGCCFKPRSWVVFLDLAIQISKIGIKAFSCPHISVPKTKSLEVVKDLTVAIARAKQVLSTEQLIEIVFVDKLVFSKWIKLLYILLSLCYHKRNKCLMHRKKTILRTNTFVLFYFPLSFFLFSIKIYMRMMLNLLSVLGCRSPLLMITHG